MVPIFLCCLLAWRLAAAAEFDCAGLSLPSETPGLRAKIAGLEPRRIHALVLYAGFADEAATPPPTHAANLFDADRVGSLRHFYRTMSFAQLALSGTVWPRRYRAAGIASDYTNPAPREPGGYGRVKPWVSSRFIREVLRQADADIDFGRFDNDGPDGVPNSGDDDGVVDYVFINLRSVPRDFLLDGATGIAGLGMRAGYATGDRTPKGEAVTVGNTKFHGSVLQAGTFSQTVGVMAHEFAHGLGLPDLYDQDYDGPEDDSAGIEAWGLMGKGSLGWNGEDGPVGFSAWSLEQLGWIGVDNERLVEVAGPLQGEVVADLFRGGRVYKVYLPTDLTRDEEAWESSQEYLLLENRLRGMHGYQRALPAEGMLVWHVRPAPPTTSRRPSSSIWSAPTGSTPTQATR
jgi:M6 family metalloprotease-like protein